MKKKLKAVLLLLTIGFCFYQPVQAQEGLKLGFFALPQSTWMLNADDMDAPKDVFDYETTVGMGAGINFGYNFNDMWGFRLNWIYSVQGQQYLNKNDDGDWVKNTKRVHYLKMPLLVGFNTNTEFNKLVFSFHAGFQAGLLMKARYYNDDQSYIPDISLYDDVTDYPNSYKQYAILEYGPVVDMGLDIKLTYNVMANIHLRADYGLGDAENKDASFFQTTAGIPAEIPFYNQDRAKTQNMTAGILFGITYTFSAY